MVCIMTPSPLQYPMIQYYPFKMAMKMAMKCPRLKIRDAQFSSCGESMDQPAAVLSMVEVLGVDQQVLSSALRWARTTHLAAGLHPWMLLDSGEKDVNKNCRLLNLTSKKIKGSHQLWLIKMCLRHLWKMETWLGNSLAQKIPGISPACW